MERLLTYPLPFTNIFGQFGVLVGLAGQREDLVGRVRLNPDVQRRLDVREQSEEPGPPLCVGWQSGTLGFYQRVRQVHKW